MIKCEECGKEFKTQQGLVGHMRFVHGIKSSRQQSLFPSKRFITDTQLDEALGAIAKRLEELQKDLSTVMESVKLLFDLHDDQIEYDHKFVETLKRRLNE